MIVVLASSTMISTRKLESRSNLKVRLKMAMKCLEKYLALVAWRYRTSVEAALHVEGQRGGAVADRASQNFELL